MFIPIEPLTDLYVLSDSICEKLYKEYGYRPLKGGNIALYINDGVVKAVWQSNNNSPYLILFFSCNETESCTNKLENCITEDMDYYCSIFAIYFDNHFNFYKKNMKTKIIERCNEIPIYKLTRRLDKEGESKIISTNFENIFFEAHSFLRDIDGLHPDEALDELCKIIYAKLHDEEVFDKQASVFTQNKYGNHEEYSASIRKLYFEANEYDMRVFSLRIPGYKRSRGVFDEPIKISSIALSKVAELFSKYSFSSSDIDIKARAFQNVYRPAARAGMGQYFTPVNVIKFIVNAVKPHHEDLIIDPFCGSAHFLTESINAVCQLKCTEKLLTDFVYYKLHGIEKSERMVRVAMTDMRLHGDGHSNIRCTDALLPFENYYDIEPNSFDIVMTNPPFGSVLSSEAVNYMGEFELNNKKSTPLEILGLERCVQLLRDGGKLAIVLPESIFVNKTFEHVRRWLYYNTRIRAIISLPIETFAPYGTNIKTSILFCSKESNHHIVDGKVFTGGIENIGYDANGKPSNGDDWNALLEELNEFLLKEGW